MKLLAVIPARKGSKRIKNKNFKPFLNDPFYILALKQALSLFFVSKVVLSTDAQIDKSQIISGVTLDNRPSNLAQDDSSSGDLACYLWKKYSDNCDGIIWLQPTSPLRRIEIINEAYKVWDKKNI